jgi:MFS family permease
MDMIVAWMQDVGAGWLMTSLSSSPSLVALVEAADTLPVMLLAFPAGAIADIVDRRRLLIAVQIYLLAVAASLGVVVSKNANSHQQTCPSAIGTSLRSTDADSVRSYKPMAVRIFANHASSDF